MSCLRLCTSAGEALPRELHDRWLETFDVEVLDGIGSSELYHIYISNRPGRARAGSTGELVPGYEGEIGDGGELLVTGDNRLKQGVDPAKARQSYEQALEAAREAGLEESIRPLVEIRLADLERLAGESPPPSPPDA
jgi:acyl-coenzyme A synthetase/AMP-(fatty) acid ligase